MFSEELNKLIEAALFDGVLTDKEKAVIIKRAVAEGADPDEVELFLDAEMQKTQRATKENELKRIKGSKNKKIKGLLFAFILILILVLCFFYVWRKNSLSANGFETYQEAVKVRDFESAHMILSNILEKYHNITTSNYDDEEKKEELLKTYQEGVDYVYNSEALFLCSIGDKESLDRIVYLLSGYPIYGVPMEEGATYRTGGVLYEQIEKHKKYIVSISKYNKMCDNLIDLAITNHNYNLIERVIPQYKSVPDPIIGNYGNMHVMKYTNLDKENAIEKVNKAIDNGTFPNVTEHIK